MLAVGEAMLEGEIKYREGEYEACYNHLQNAIDLSDALVYDEPWGWMQPPRHAMGALLLEQVYSIVQYSTYIIFSLSIDSF